MQLPNLGPSCWDVCLDASHVQPICICLPGTLLPDCTDNFMFLGVYGSELVYSYKQIKLTHGQTLEGSTRPLQGPAGTRAFRTLNCSQHSVLLLQACQPFCPGWYAVFKM